MLRLSVSALLLVALAACGSKGSGTEISITGDNGSAGVAGGTAKIDVPGFKGQITLPKFQLDSTNLDIDGVKLFPGSSVSGMAVDARGKDADGVVRIAFSAPASAVAVRDYYRDALTRKSFSLADDGAGLSGKTDDGKPFHLKLTPTTADKTSGEILLGG